MASIIVHVLISALELGTMGWTELTKEQAEAISNDTTQSVENRDKANKRLAQIDNAEETGIRLQDEANERAAEGIIG
jgi:aryl-alcohol dehydrogenase-like predicted oxidoreductase